MLLVKSGWSKGDVVTAREGMATAAKSTQIAIARDRNEFMKGDAYPRKVLPDFVEE
jgi:hypothetical protein